MPTPAYGTMAMNNPAWWHKGGGLLLDSRVVDLPRLYTPTFVTIFFGKPFFFNGLKNEFCFSDNGGA
jgi:hypothetical protein